ncbi:DNA-binding protein snt1 [Coemansia sp. RSA 1722]|nr:DNA-binding protein snt1 [Coemansia sp. RSA 485]KAJ2591212.1 DNA-binding protein snt1 [Coemansia sp. RSA 1722]
MSFNRQALSDTGGDETLKHNSHPHDQQQQQQQKSNVRRSNSVHRELKYTNTMTETTVVGKPTDDVLEEGELDDGTTVGNGGPKLALQSRISDIDKEIAACQERLVMMSSVDNKTETQVDDRMVPGSTGEEKADAADGGRTAAVAAAVVAAVVPALQADSDNDSNSSDNEQQTRDRSSALISSVYADNQRRAAQTHLQLATPFLHAYPLFVPGAYAQPSDWPFWQENELVHQQLRPHLARVLGRELLQDKAHTRKLQEEYRELYVRWRRRVDRLDRQRDAKQRAEREMQSPVVATSQRRRAGAQAAAAIDEFGFSLGPLFSASSGIVDGADLGLFTSDAVHSDAELQKIIERLQHDDARNPDLRSQRTAATIPPMALSPDARALLRVDNNNHRIDDPLTYYHARVPAPSDPEYRRVAYANNGDTDHFWTQAEVSQFVAAYLAHPKQFGRIAAAVPHKSMNACVLFYYRNKKQLRLKELEARSNKRARRSRPLQAPSGSRKRKERARERRERRAREEREKIANEVAAAASCVSTTETPLDNDELVHNDNDSRDAVVAGRRAKSSALLRSIIAANRQRKRGLSATMEPGAPAMGDDVEDDDDEPEDAAIVAVCVPVPADEDAPITSPSVSAVPSRSRQTDDEDGDDDDEEEGELVDHDPSPSAPRAAASRRQRPRSELNAYAMGGSIVRTRRSREIEDSVLAALDAAESSASSSSSESANSDLDEIVEASGVVSAVGSSVVENTRPRVVSRKSQSRFGVTLTAIIEPSGEEPASDADAPLSMWQSQSVRRDPDVALLTETALDRYVTETSSLRRPISSYETLLICSSAGGADPTTVEAANATQPADSVVAAAAAGHKRHHMDAQVDEQAGPQDTVLVGAAAWLRDDRRRVLRGFHQFGCDFAQVASLMPSKSMAQCRYFFYHYRTPQGVLISDMFSAATTKPANITSVDALVLPPTNTTQAREPVHALDGAKRQRTRSPEPVNSNSSSSSSEDDDETPLAAQLAEEMAARAADNLPLITQQRRASEIIAQTRPELLLPRAPSLASLALPQRPASNAVADTKPSVEVASASVSTSVANSVAGRTPSPLHHQQQQQQQQLMTAKKSGYSSYWSVHERSAFMHYVVRLGQDWLALAEAIGSKTGTQVRNYFRANREKLGLDSVIVEYQRNRMAGTLPKMTPFQPPVSLPVVSGSSVVSREDMGIMRKERRGRKRKTEMPRSATTEQSGGLESLPLVRTVVEQQPNTAPASMASFPTMGVDGGRAVVYSRPPTGVRPMVSARPPPPPPPPQQIWQHDHQVARKEGVREGSAVARAESDTVSSQPTPPPVDGLPRFSSSPAPSMVYHNNRPAATPAYGALHISNLTTTSVSATESSAGNVSGFGPRAEVLGSPVEESRKESVTKINALLNNDEEEPGDTRANAGDWFGESSDTKQMVVSNEDEATGIAALALASMMGSANRTPVVPQQQTLLPPRTRPQSVAGDSRLPSVSSHYQHQIPASSTGVFAPTPQSIQYRSAVHGSPMVGSSPPLHQQQQQTRPSSVGPSMSYGQQMSPATMHASPKRIIPPGQQTMRQRKPSAPVMPMHIATTNGQPMGGLLYISLPPPSAVAVAPVAGASSSYHGYHGHQNVVGRRYQSSGVVQRNLSQTYVENSSYLPRLPQQQQQEAPASGGLLHSGSPQYQPYYYPQQQQHPQHPQQHQQHPQHPHQQHPGYGQPSHPSPYAPNTHRYQQQHRQQPPPPP